MVTVAVLDKFHPHIKAAIEAAMPAEWHTVFIEEATLAERVTAVRDADVALVMAAPIAKEVVAAGQKLRFIQKLGAGVDHIDLDACRERGIGVARLHAGNSIPVAEHTVLLMLAVYRQLPQIDRRTRVGAWDKESARGEHRQLLNKTIGLIGLGAVGKQVAKHLRGFDATVIYYDPVRPSAELEQSLGVSYAEFDDLVRRCRHCLLASAVAAGDCRHHQRRAHSCDEERCGANQLRAGRGDR